jgi:hypothetical protein
MSESSADCAICRGPDGDAEFERFQVWEDRHWRLTVSLAAEVPGFAYLEPKRHVPHITDLDGPEAQSFGEVLARTTKPDLQAHNRRRLAGHEYDPSDLILSSKDPRCLSTTPASGAGSGQFGKGSRLQ